MLQAFLPREGRREQANDSLEMERPAVSAAEEKVSAKEEKEHSSLGTRRSMVIGLRPENGQQLLRVLQDYKPLELRRLWHSSPRLGAKDGQDGCVPCLKDMIREMRLGRKK